MRAYNLSRLPPIALQPSLGHYFSQVNEKWRKGYEMQTNNIGHIISGPKLSHVVIVSVSGGIYDYQVCFLFFLMLVIKEIFDDCLYFIFHLY